MNTQPSYSGPASRDMRGFSLIELMISLILGLLVVGGAIGMFMSNKRTYNTTENLGRIQENARVAFELMAREVREAAGTPCAKNLPVANVLNGAGTDWWNNWGRGVFGFENGALAGSVPGTDAIELLSGESTGVSVVDHVTSSAQFKVNTVNHGIEDFDVLMVCDYSQASIFQVTNASDTNVTIVHNTGNVSEGPGNCTKALGLPVNCTAPNPQQPYKLYAKNSQIVKLHAARWYIGANTNGGRSLYRITMRRGVAQPAEEVAEGIQDMQITYLVGGATSYVAAAAGTNWANVTAVRIVLTIETARGGQQGRELRDTSNNILTRTLTHTVTLRNRMS
ncbi:prepilin-type N-terminal cleavage/methylation domain-containing protein [Lysobacter psychrotolerans]|uniref:Prepilin-type N-terminal cleavage/methylation domain-containing protein n=2 Tax=Montanilutibacter psychrotolerans TaxID=1327343 RepID=A0A3M8SYQ9_9GAMM|nr:prepilin-type N-terminal cleavage/methylation domain-containing protein [Lysobacter psychrotolerans]